MFKNNKIILAFLLALVIAAGYFLVYKKEKSGFGDLESNGGTNLGEAPSVGQDLLMKLSTLESLEIDDGFFKDRAFMSLIDFSYPISTSTAIGRSNPFSPIRRAAIPVSGSSSSSSSSSKAQNKIKK